MVRGGVAVGDTVYGCDGCGVRGGCGGRDVCDVCFGCCLCHCVMGVMMW